MTIRDYIFSSPVLFRINVCELYQIVCRVEYALTSNKYFLYSSEMLVSSKVVTSHDLQLVGYFDKELNFTLNPCNDAVIHMNVLSIIIYALNHNEYIEIVR